MKMSGYRISYLAKQHFAPQATPSIGNSTSTQPGISPTTPTREHIKAEKEKLVLDINKKIGDAITKNATDPGQIDSLIDLLKCIQDLLNSNIITANMNTSGVVDDMRKIGIFDDTIDIKALVQDLIKAATHVDGARFLFGGTFAGKTDSMRSIIAHVHECQYIDKNTCATVTARGLIAAKKIELRITDKQEEMERKLTHNIIECFGIIWDEGDTSAEIQLDTMYNPNGSHELTLAINSILSECDGDFKRHVLKHKQLHDEYHQSPRILKEAAICATAIILEKYLRENNVAGFPAESSTELTQCMKTLTRKVWNCNPSILYQTNMFEAEYISGVIGLNRRGIDLILQNKANYEKNQRKTQREFEDLLRTM